MTPKWPILPSGAVDWQKVFQHPETGLMANVERADNPEKLQACMHVIVDALFSRYNDAGVRRSFLASINELFTGKKTTLVAKKAKINMLLSHIMYDREDRAQKYMEMQAKKQAGQSDQRMDKDDPLKVLEDI